MLKTAKIIGLNSDIEAALALVSQFQTEAQGDKLHFFAIVYCSQDDAFSRARQALSEAEGTFFSSTQPVSERLNETLEVVKKSLLEAQNLQILLAAITEDQAGKVLYILEEGEDLKGYLLREGKENDLLGISREGLVSGILEEGDRVVLSTKSLVELLGDSHILKETPIDILEDEISAKLPEAENYPVAAIIIEVEKILQVEEKVKRPRNLKLIYLGVGILILILVGTVFFFRQKKEPVKKVELSGQGGVNPTENPTETLKSFPVGEFPLWLDLGLIKDGFIAEKLSLSLGKLLVLDENQKTLVSINLENKSQQILAGKDKLGEAQRVSLNGDLAWVFSKDKGLLRVDEDKKVLVVEKTDDEWGEILELVGFARNAYLLDKGGQVWKYVPVEAGYSDKIAYFKEGVKVDFAQVLRMQIDSSLWVLKAGGEILKFTQGSPDNFSFSGLDKGVKGVKSFFVSDETDNLYILDSGNNRLLVVDKKGAYVSQYQGDKFGSFNDLVVDEKNKKAYLLDEGKIFQLELK